MLLMSIHFSCLFQANPELRRAQKKLAEEVTLLVHGGDNLLENMFSVDSTYSKVGPDLFHVKCSPFREIYQSCVLFNNTEDKFCLQNECLTPYLLTVDVGVTSRVS